MKKSFLVGAFSAFVATTFLVQAQSTKVLTPLTSFGVRNDGTIQPGDIIPPTNTTNITTGSAQRGMAYNPVTGNLILVDRQANGNGTNVITGVIYVMDGTTGNNITTLNTNGMDGGNYADCAVGVADDGAVYVANMVNNAVTTPFTIYRWDSDASANPPFIAYKGNPGVTNIQPRWGESMDIRGSGTSTQIIVGSRATGGFRGTNVVIFTTADGTNFTPTCLNTDIGSNDSGFGIAFGAGNTFWTKCNSGAPLRQLSFDLATSNATTIHIFATNTLPASASLGPIAVDSANNLLATLELSSPNRVRLYDISDLSNPPVLLDVKTFTPNNANAVASAGFLDFGGGRLYVHSINNGMMEFTIDTSSPSAPTVLTQPNGSARLAEGRTVYMETLAYPVTSYQWQKDGNNIAGATLPTLALTNITVNDTGNYSVNASNDGGTTFASSSMLINVISLSNLYHLNVMWSSNATTGNAGGMNQGGGSSTPNQRTLAYNSFSNQLYVVSRGTSGNQLFTITVYNATNGTPLYNLKTNGISGGAIGLVGIAVADDGAIYACNMDTANPQNWRLYRWADSGPTTLPTLVFAGDPTQQGTSARWGDVLTVRGSGMNTQVMVNNIRVSATVGNVPYVAVLTPSDETMTNFVAVYGNLDPSCPVTGIGRSIQFGPGDNTMWHKNKGTALFHSNFDPSFSGGLASLIETFTNFPTTLGAVNIDFSRNLLAGVDFNGTAGSAPDSVALYDVTDFNSPLFITRYNFGISEVANANFIGQVLFAGNYLFAIDGNNGLMAFLVTQGASGPPALLTQPANLRLITGQSGSMRVSSPDAATYQWSKDGSNIAGATNSIYSITNAQLTDAGSYIVVLSNSAGSTTSAVATVSVTAGTDVYQLSQIWAEAANSTNYISSTGPTTSPNERAIAFDPALNHLYVSQKNGTSYNVYVVDGTTGALLSTLNTNGVVMDGTAPSGQTWVALNALGVAADGSIYAATLAPDSCGCSTANGYFRLYRWADSDPNTLPVQVFQGDPAGQTNSLRWGDVLDVRGSGTNTQIILNNNQGTLGTILTPTDSSMATFTFTAFTNNMAASPIGRSLQYANTLPNVFWQKRSGGDLQFVSFDLTTNSSTIITNYPVFPSSLGPVALDTSRNILAGLNFSSTTNAPDSIDLYDISSVSTPLLMLGRYNFPANSKSNPNFIGQVLISGNKVFAIDGNNGVVAFNLLAPVGPTLNVSVSGNSVTISWTNSPTGFRLQLTPTLSPPQWTSIDSPVTESNNVFTLTQPMSPTMMFYRLIK